MRSPSYDHGPQYTLDISGRDDQLRFLRRIGVQGERAAACQRLRAALEQLASNSHIDTIPQEVWSRVEAVLTDRRAGHQDRAAVAASTRAGGGASWKQAPSRQPMARVAEVLDSADLELHATNDVLWDEVVAIESLGLRDVYDATVPGLPPAEAARLRDRLAALGEDAGEGL